MTFTPPEPAPSSLPDLVGSEGSAVSPVAEPAAVSEPATGTVPALEPSRHLATQTEFPWRTAIRSGVGTLLFALAAIAAICTDPTVGAFVSAHFPNLLPRVLIIGAFCAALATVIKRIGSIPAVAALFVRIGLGVVPKSALKP